LTATSSPEIDPMSASLRDLYETARALPAAQRVAYLEQQCTDPAMRERVLRMLDAGADATDAPLPLAPAQRLAAQIGQALPLPGTRIGPFELCELIGEGGYATVFRAVREVDGVQHEVALKLLHGTLFSPQAQRQFRREHEALARLRHPAIAALIDAGVTEAGQAWLALQLVRGVPITQYARARRLDLGARLRLFVQVCRAVEAAHWALVVHRDLKPANVLVSDEGRVQLIDFGVARRIDADEATHTHAPGFTPAYAAPELHRGEHATPATDVYALGVLLGELLTGERLNDGSGRTPSARVADGEATDALPAPPAALRRRLRGDLDNVLMKAIAPEPAQRYVYAGALADDVEAWLDGRPVAAHPPSRWYRTRKFVARHRGAVASTLAFSLAVLAALALALWQAREARHQAQRAGQVQRFVEEMFAPLEAGADNDRAPSLQQLLQRGVERVRTDAPDDAQVRAELLTMFARIQDALGEVRGNLALAESALAAAHEAWGAEDRRVLDAQLLFARVLRKDGQSQRAIEVAAAARAAMQRAGIGGLPYSQTLDIELNARVGMGDLAPDEHVQRRREILALRQADPASTPDDLASAWNNLGFAQEGRSDWTEAAQSYQRAFELRHAALGDSVGAALSLANVGNTYSWSGEWRRALETMEQARAIWQRARIARHANYAQLLVRLCDVRTLMQHLPDAQRDCDAGLAMTEAVLGPDSDSYGMALARRAALQLAQGDASASRTTFAQARAVLERIGGNATSRLRALDVAEAARWRLLGEFDTMRDRLLPIAALERTPEQWSAPLIYTWLALACAKAPAPDCGSGRIAQADRVLAAPRFARSGLQLPAAVALAQAELAGGDRVAAAARLEQAIATVREVDATHAWMGEAWWWLARASDDPARRTEAEARARTVLAALPPSHPLRHASSFEPAPL
jgi:tetratricopeptide (TPR) repeat protein